MVHSGFIWKVKATGFFGGLGVEHQRKKFQCNRKRGQMVEMKWKQMQEAKLWRASLLHPLINTISIYSRTVLNRIGLCFLVMV